MVEKESFRTVWCIEQELYAQTILRKRFPNAKIYGDAKKVNFSTVSQIDVLTFGFPCQDISNAGKRAGIKGSRSSLWKVGFKAIGILRPKVALIENVSALTIRGLNIVLADLASIGYDAEWYCVWASSVGAWHKRRRIFIIAYPNLHGCNTLRQDGRRIQDYKKQYIQAVPSEGIQSTTEFIKDGSLEYVSNPHKEGLQRWQETRNIETCGKKGEQQFTRQSGFWATEPKLGRVANGIPSRVDRIKCLGNAVVPQVAEVFAQAIKEEIKT